MNLVVAIDGPAASGKSTVARELARKLKFAHVDSGAFYRAITWWVLSRGANPSSFPEVTKVLADSRIESGFSRGAAFLRINGQDATPHIRDEAVNRDVSPVSLVPAVRNAVTGHLRELAGQRDVVVEGRDIGSVVFPETSWKFYLDASPEVRRRRRIAQGQEDEIGVRDRIDSSRPNAPLVVPRGAIIIDTTGLSIESAVEKMLALIKTAGTRHPSP